MTEKNVMHVRVDSDMCMGSRFCLITAPNVFAEREDGTSGVRSGDKLIDGPVPVPPEDTEAAQQAAMICPAQAIHLSGGDLEAKR
ncbi:ferredoxin [Mycolicibacter sinensis]|uniref:Ferredoxin n=1 Tax=Mycolicibacter sinensis (strain JDM601) TaxID=875328 RepID=A0A1A3U847_MYCSD|nr:ferredoxin [Mycolicibacter sinensis]OBK91095.1 hypothetical protein A5648_15430 [Mycolicibacter sinensis]